MSGLFVCCLVWFGGISATGSPIGCGLALVLFLWTSLVARIIVESVRSVVEFVFALTLGGW